MTPATKLYPRPLVHRVREALADTPVVFVNGPRQAGKTTLVRRLVEPDRRYLTLDGQPTLATGRRLPLDPGLEARVAGGGFPAVAPSGSGSICNPSSVETSGISPRWTKELLV